MSLLAEPRRRQKWTLNPRGNLWANDESKFGQKLMEKMGWEKGKVSIRFVSDKGSEPDPHPIGAWIRNADPEGVKRAKINRKTKPKDRYLVKKSIYNN
jgi:hypothetical protein